MLSKDDCCPREKSRGNTKHLATAKVRFIVGKRGKVRHGWTRLIIYIVPFQTRLGPGVCSSLLTCLLESEVCAKVSKQLEGTVYLRQSGTSIA